MDWQAGIIDLRIEVMEELGGLRGYLRQESEQHQTQYDTLHHEVSGMNANFIYMMEMMQQLNAFPPQLQQLPPQQPPTYHPFWYPQ